MLYYLQAVSMPLGKVFKMHKSDPAYFLGLPGLSWALAMKNVPEGKSVELLEKAEDYLAFQNSIQGGICQVSQRYMKRMYDERTKESLNQIMYFDVNGLYGHIMAGFKLPHKLVEHKTEDLPHYDYSMIKALSEDKDYTYFFVIDASISEIMIERNPALTYLPFFPRRVDEKSIKKSEFTKSQSEKHNIQDTDSFKLACVLDKTERYLVHIKCLKLALDAGYNLDKVHEYYKFSQEYIFKDYMEQNNKIKAHATKEGNELLRQLPNYLNNILYGKTIQDILKQ